MERLDRAEEEVHPPSPYLFPGRRSAWDNRRSGIGVWDKEMSGGRKIRRGRSVNPQKLETEVQESLPQVFCSSAGHDTEVLDLEDRGKRDLQAVYLVFRQVWYLLELEKGS